MLNLEIQNEAELSKTLMMSIAGKEYEVSVKASARDLKTFLNAKTDNCQQAFSEFFQRRILGDESLIPSLDLITAQPEEAFAPYIMALLDREKTVKACFEKRAEVEPIRQRYVLSVKDAAKISSVNISNALKESLLPMMDAVHKSLDIYWNGEFKKISEAISSIVDSYNSLWKSFRIPAISEEQKESIRRAHEVWGGFGWTQIPSAPSQLFAKVPDSMEDANRIALQYCKTKDMQELFELLRGTNRVKQSDLEEAIFDYQNRQYKSCALVLFGLIDARLIRLQREEDRNKRGNRREVGKRAAEKLFAHINQEENIEKKIFLLFDFQNIYSCILKFFEDGNDFVSQPHLANRNFLDHGMLHRKVLKRDCIQLFLLYYNLMEFLNIIYPPKEI